MSEGEPAKKTAGHFEHEAHFNSLFVLLPFIIGIPTVMLIPAVLQSPTAASAAAIFLGVCGIILFSIAKFSMFKQGHWLTLGSSRMTKGNRILYRSGYALIILSGFISGAIMIAGRMLEQ